MGNDAVRCSMYNNVYLYDVIHARACVCVLILFVVKRLNGHVSYRRRRRLFSHRNDLDRNSVDEQPRGYRRRRRPRSFSSSKPGTEKPTRFVVRSRATNYSTRISRAGVRVHRCVRMAVGHSAVGADFSVVHAIVGRPISPRVSTVSPAGLENERRKGKETKPKKKSKAIITRSFVSVTRRAYVLCDSAG